MISEFVHEGKYDWKVKKVHFTFKVVLPHTIVCISYLVEIWFSSNAKNNLGSNIFEPPLYHQISNHK